MRLHRVESSMLRRIGYDPYRRLLVAQFREGNYYEYYDVPVWVFALVMTDDSLGQAFHDHVLGRFEYRRIEDRSRRPQEQRHTEDAAMVH
jgi:KTSC domain